MELKKSDLESLSLFHIPKDMRSTDKLFICGNYLYKIFGDNSFITEKNRNIDFLMQEKIFNTPNIETKLFKGNEFCGYIMDYIPNAKTFRQAIKENIKEELKVKAIKDVYEVMKYLHAKDIYLGDIHSDNMLITKDNGYIVVLEEIRFPGDEFKFKQCYLIRPNNLEYRINIPSKYTDNIKLMICSLSLLFNKDFEMFIDPKSYEINLEKFYHELIIPLNDDRLALYFEDLIGGEFTEYFSDYYFDKLDVKKK